MSEIWFRTGEATVLAADGQYTDAMPEVLIGSTRGPVGQAFAGMMGQVQGHTRMFVVRDLNREKRWSHRLLDTGDAIVDCVIEGVLPKDGLDELCMIIMIWLDPRCAEDPDLDRKDLYRTNYEATKLAIGRAIRGEPTIDELIANRRTVKHYALEDVIDY